MSNLVKKRLVVLEHVQGTRNQKVIRLTEDGRDYGENKVRWIFRAEKKALEQTDPKQVQSCIEMIEKYISHLKKSFVKFSVSYKRRRIPVSAKIMEFILMDQLISQQVRF